MTRLSAADISEFENRVEGASRIAILTHIRPDGDALGSTGALQSYLREVKGKDAVTLITGPVPEYLKFVTEGAVITDAAADPDLAMNTISGCDLLVGLDFNNFGRTEGLAAAAAGSEAFKILVDHHIGPDRDNFGLIFSETEVSSTCELLYWLLLGTSAVNGVPGNLPLRCREALMTGMTTDTNNFANSVFPTTLLMASGLLESGVDRNAIVDRLYKNDREEKVRLFSFLIGDRMTISPEGVALVILDAETASRFGTRDGETEGLVNIPLSIDRVRMSIFAREDNGRMRISIRSKSGISANTLARESFHGGGHEQAAGGKLSWPEDIPDKNHVAAYIQDTAARFMQKHNISVE